MKIFFIKRENKIEPIYRMSMDYVDAMQRNVIYSAEMRKPRNPKFHNLVFALAKCALDNMPENRQAWKHYTPYEFIKMLQIEIGATEKMIRLNGEVVQIPKSIAFESMDENEFEKTIAEPMFEVCAKILGCTVDELKTNYVNYL